VNLRQKDLMDNTNARRLSLLAIILVPAMPAIAGMIAFRSQPILIAAVTGNAGKLPFLTNIFFNHFAGSLLLLLVISVILAYLAFTQLKQADLSERFAGLLATVCAAALVSVLYIGLFILSVCLPLYAKLTER